MTRSLAIRARWLEGLRSASWTRSLASCAPHTGKFCFIEGTEMEATLAELCVRNQNFTERSRHGRDLLDSVALPVLFTARPSQDGRAIAEK